MASSLRQTTRFAVFGVPMGMLTRALEQTPRPITLPYLLAQGGRPGEPPTPDVILRSAKYTQQELPVRLARRVRQFYSLPFIVGTNPYIQEVARLYASSFEHLSEIKPIETLEDNDHFVNELQKLVDDHAEVVPTLSRGFMECGEYMDSVKITNFLNAALHSRIGIRIIAEQHLALTATAKSSRNTDEMSPVRLTPTSVGIVDTEMAPADVIRQSSEYVRALCEATFEMAPEVVLEGQVDARTMGIPVHLDYVMTELLKNAFRATTETFLAARQAKKGPATITPITVTLASTPSHVSVRIRDAGGGIPPESMAHIFDYAYTTVKSGGEDANSAGGEDITDVSAGAMQSSMGTLAGLGYGLPLSRLYLGYFGMSSLDIVSLWGHVRKAHD
ncbi:hypothetical protein MEQU1_000437 [Malassezia equina]|uniref:Protein-serine/threonine kinase n=1 Tax=Malassezia equina TaxID=1381935 RepID=A0AAF0EFK2_9BASI|nr:hypothetical protein MEQU1_000437 [Malassezia equina]